MIPSALKVQSCASTPRPVSPRAQSGMLLVRHARFCFCSHVCHSHVRELLEADAGGRGGGGGGGRGFDVSKAGDTRVGFVGFPSVGKSTLLTKLTGTHSEAAAYEASVLAGESNLRRTNTCAEFGAHPCLLYPCETKGLRD